MVGLGPSPAMDMAMDKPAIDFGQRLIGYIFLYSASLDARIKAVLVFAYAHYR
jgi:hypothetical protein